MLYCLNAPGINIPKGSDLWLYSTDHWKFCFCLLFLHGEVKTQTRLQYRTRTDGYSVSCLMTLKCCRMFVSTYSSQKERSLKSLHDPAVEWPIHVSQNPRTHKEKCGFVIQLSKLLLLPEGQLYFEHSLGRLRNHKTRHQIQYTGSNSIRAKAWKNYKIILIARKNRLQYLVILQSLSMSKIWFNKIHII